MGFLMILKVAHMNTFKILSGKRISNFDIANKEIWSYQLMVDC